MDFDMNIFLFITNLFIFVLCGGMFMILPHITRKSLLFGVKIPSEEANCQEAVEMKRRYIRNCFLGIVFLLTVCVVQFIMAPDFTLIATLYFPLLIIPIYLLAFIPNWKRAVRLKEEKGWQVSAVRFAETSSSHSRGNLSTLPWLWYVISFVIVAVTFVMAIMRYPYLPDMIATRFDANMQPVNFAEKTWWSLLAMPLINLAMLGIMAFVAIGIEKMKLQIDPSRPRLSFAQHLAYRRRMGNAMGFLTATMVLMIAIVGLPILYPDASIWNEYFFWASMALIAIPILILVVVQIKTGQGGCKVKIDIDEKGDENKTETAKIKTGGSGDDKYWLLGMFYYNPEDPAILVEDRFGTNMGFNYAHLSVKIGTAILLIGLVAMYAWLTITLIQ